jgi:hypothetical protein
MQQPDSFPSLTWADANGTQMIALDRESTSVGRLMLATDGVTEAETHLESSSAMKDSCARLRLNGRTAYSSGWQSSRRRILRKMTARSSRLNTNPRPQNLPGCVDMEIYSKLLMIEL